MRTSRSTSRSVLVAAAVAAALTAGGSPGYANEHKPTDPNGANNATRCDEKAVELAGQKLVNDGDVLVDGFDLTYEEGAISEETFVTIDSVDEHFNVTGVVVKGGPEYTVYRVGEDIYVEDLPWALSTPEHQGDFPKVSHWFLCGYQDSGLASTLGATSPDQVGTGTGTPTTGLGTTAPGERETTAQREGAAASSSSNQSAAPETTSPGNGTPAVSSGETEDLASTGFSNAWLIWLGGALVLAGVAALVLIRVRRDRS